MARTRSRLLGFGPWGYALTAAFIAILLWGLLSTDPHHQLLVGVYRVLGIDAVYWSVLWLISYHYLALQDFGFHLGFASILAVAIFISGRRITWLGYLAIFLFAVLGARIWYLYMGLYHNGLAFQFPFSLAFSLAHVFNPTDHGAAAGSVLWLFTAAPLLALLSRSWIVGTATASLAIFPLFDPYLFRGYVLLIPATPLRPLFEITTNLALAHIWYAAILGYWAWRVRSRIPPHTSGCQSCGYDLTDLESPTCPECGNPIAQRGASPPPQ